MLKLYAALLIIGFLMVCIGSFFDLLFLILGLSVVVASTLVFYIWITNHYTWTCPKCGTQFSISFKESVLAVNSGNFRKKLTCPKCGHSGYMDGTKTN